MRPRIIIILIGSGLAALIIIPIAWQLGGALAASLSVYASLTGALLGAVLLLAALGGLRILFAHGRRAAALARQAEIVTMQNQQPIHLDDVTLFANSLLARSLDRYYDQQLALAERSQYPNLSSIHQVIQPAPAAAAPASPALPDAGLPQLVSDSEWRRWMDRAPHLLIAGRTEAGKTTLATALLIERALAGDQILVLDPHYQPGKWAGVPTIGGGNDFENILATLPQLVREMRQRYAEFEQGKPTEDFQRLTVLIDEVPAIVDACMGTTPAGRPRLDDPRWSKFAKRLGSEARKVRISVMLMTQSTLVQDILINTQQRENYLRVALGDRSRGLIEEEPNSKRRQALHELLVGQQHPAAMEWMGSFHLLDTSAVPDLAARRIHTIQPWTPPALPDATAPQQSPAPRQATAPTAELPPPTVQEQILMLLDVRPWLTSSEIAARLQIDLQVVRVELTTLKNRHALARRSAPDEKSDKYEWSLSKPLNELMADRVALSA